MLSLRDQVIEFAAVERATGRAGDLVTCVVAHIRGDYRAGPVPVTVRYHSYFRYESEWPDERGNLIQAAQRDFDSPGERDAYNSTHFTVIDGRG